ncbi:hypothetical protein JOB18_011412 [Solea senegalensis]|uniref:Uncharacterized protein n=1 Tax=Solea senegalensis TaxID=28829 RepID=A0AAV6S5N8_SOLSE|nr:UPF0538 protein C2orf76 homolog [Solea senegalensis]KAG7511817.1 hypothetical protein JOB18_011412 [Solea senegalensis]
MDDRAVSPAVASSSSSSSAAASSAAAAAASSSSSSAAAAAETVVTVRLIRSFEHRNFRPVVFRGVSLDQTLQDFMQLVRDEIARRPGVLLPFRTYTYDTMKIIHQAHGAKTNELVMNLENDEDLILQDGQTLRAAGVANETEVAFFREEDYTLFKANPKTAW